MKMMQDDMHMIMEELEGTTNVKHGEVLIESSR